MNAPSPIANEAALEIADLVLDFGGLRAIDNVSLRIPPGDRRLLLGPNGAGKTTLFNLITGELRPSHGRVRLFGCDITGCAPHRCAHFGLARTYQILTLFPRHSLLENVIFALLGIRRARWNPISSPMRRHDVETSALAALERVGLAEKAKEPLSQTSYGEKRRLEIALALSQEPRVLLLDEPLAGLSREERRVVQTLIASIPRDVTILLIEHDMDVALELADSVTVMQRGRVICDGARDAVIADPKVREVYLAG